MSSSSAQILRQAEALKATISDSGTGANEAWVCRQTLQDLYQKLLVVDLEFALDKKVEQDLWNHAFKNQINLLQGQSKDRQNPKRNEIQSSLQLFLQTASGFYLQLLQELCSVFHLDLPFRRKSAYLGILKESKLKIKTPEQGSCLYICQHCLVHLGDIARYRQQIEQAQTYYRHAAILVPFNGQPYNQLAILETAKGNKLSTVFFYIRSIAVKHPFPVASTNLEKLYSKLSKETLEYRGKLSMSEIIMAFLQFHAFVHLHKDFERARKLSDKLLSCLPTHITSMSFTSYQLIQMISINLYSMYHQKRQIDSGKSKNRDTIVNSSSGGGEKHSKDEEKAYTLVFTNTVSFLDNLLHHTPKQEHKAKEYHTLPAIKVILDWLHLDKDLLCKPAFKNSTIWPNMSKLLNNLQFHNNTKDGSFYPEKYAKSPLPEEVDLQSFLAIHKCYGHLDFNKLSMDSLSHETETRLRCHHLVKSGIWISEQFPSLNLINVQQLVSGRHQFSAPTAQVKVLPGGENSTSQERKSCRQNVAIQAIMQNRASKKNMAANSQTAAPPAEKEVTILTAQQNKKQKSEDGANAGSDVSSALSHNDEWPYPGKLKATGAKRPAQGSMPVKRGALSGGQPTPLQSPTAATAPHLPLPQQSQQFAQQQRCPSPRQVSPHHHNQAPQHAGHVPINSAAMEHHSNNPPKNFPQTRMMDHPAAMQQHLSTSPGYSSIPHPQLIQQPHSQKPLQQQQQHVKTAQFSIPLTTADAQFKGQNQHQQPQIAGKIMPSANQFQNQMEGQYHGYNMQASSTNFQAPQGQMTGKAAQGGNTAISPCPSPLGGLPIKGSAMYPHPMSASAVRSRMMTANSTNLNIPPPSSNTVNHEGYQQRAPLASSLGGLQHNNMEAAQQRMRSMQQGNSNPGVHPLAGLHQPINTVQYPRNAYAATPQQLQQQHAQSGMAPSSGQRGVRQMMMPKHISAQQQQQQQHPGFMHNNQINFHANNNNNQEIKRSDFAIDTRMPPPSTINLNTNFQLPSVNFQGIAEDRVLKPDSPPPTAQSLFSQHGNEKSTLYSLNSEQGDSVAGTYSLFSQSPWSMNINAAANGKPNSEASSFSSQSSSLRGTPDPFGDGQDTMIHSNAAPGNFGYTSYGGEDRSWVSPQRLGHPTGGADKSSSSGGAADGSHSTLLSSNIQSLWTSGPSPLERLLEQQKTQRQNDPH